MDLDVFTSSFKTSTSLSGHEKLSPTWWPSQAYRMCPTGTWQEAPGAENCEGHSLETENSSTSAGQTFAFPPPASLDTSKAQVKHGTGPEREGAVCAEPTWAVRSPSWVVR